MTVRYWTYALSALVVAAGGITGTPTAGADNKRLNDGVVANVYTMQHQAGCTTDIKINPKLRLAAQWHTDDVLNNRALNGDIGSDGSTVADRARNAGYAGAVAETTAINPALAISGVELINQWYHRPDYHAIMSDCANVDIGVWSANLIDRTVVVAVYGKGDGNPPVQAPGRPFGTPGAGVPG
ncbi:MAG TPA: CAP domain-containing protein [Mycobacterium sp.]